MTAFTLSDVKCYNLQKPPNHPNTGIGFFNHMLDQITSHAQIGVSVTVTTSPSDDLTDINRNASTDQAELLSTVGTALGQKLHALLYTSTDDSSSDTSRPTASHFSCPLDEALVSCSLTPTPDRTPGRLTSFSLAPYGTHPPVTGRTTLGHLRTAAIESFFTSLAAALCTDVSLVKIRGENGHHVVESAFKAFSRALRNLADGVDTLTSVPEVVQRAWWRGMEADSAPLARTAEIKRETKETQIGVSLNLDPSSSSSTPNTSDTGIPLLDTALITLANAASLSLDVNCRGDLHIDDHHTSEDVAIAVGQCLDRALGSKAGLNRMWSATARVGAVEVEVVTDLSNRPCLTQNLSFGASVEVLEGLSMEMVYHFFESLVVNGKMTVHIVQKGPVGGGGGKSVEEEEVQAKDVILAAVTALGRCLKMCASVDPRRGGATASSKGTLSA